jgi:hypothetical protein
MDVETEPAFVETFEKAPTARAIIPYRHNYCKVKVFNGLLQKAPKALYQCTFWRITFSSKYTWSWHEATTHKPKVTWICCKTVEYPHPNVNRFNMCAFCSRIRQHREHFNSDHRVNDCKDQPLPRRIFLNRPTGTAFSSVASVTKYG